MYSVTIYFSSREDADRLARASRTARDTGIDLAGLAGALSRAGEVDGPNSTDPDPEYIEDPAELRRFLAAAANPCSKPARQPSNT